jgi:glutamate-ammonia-ligase adenylyltransferase
MTDKNSIAKEYSELVARWPEQGLPSNSPASFSGVAAEDFDAQLRQWRNGRMASIAAADIENKMAVKDVLEAVTEVAEQSLQAALLFHKLDLENRFGLPVDEQGQEIGFFILGMGKLGGSELNFSSDIDLICLYDRSGKTAGAKSITAEEFYHKLVKALTQSLNSVTEFGFVFRVDLRLRPYGGAGPLVMHLDQAEQYYETQGRDWERYAFIKARPVAGDLALGREFLQRLKPFIYRRYLDFTALHGLRDLKAKIEKQYASKRLDDNVKLGPGGIREIEFIAQSFQLVRAGQLPALQTTSIYQALSEAATHKLLSATEQNELIAAYEFLRRVENRLQQRRDQQVHHLPDSDLEQQALAKVLGYENYAAFCQALQRHRDTVRRQFELVLVVEEQASQSVELLPAIAEYFAPLLESPAFERLSERAQKYIGLVLHQVGQQNPSDKGLAFLAQLLDNILGRTTYLALLAEQPKALDRLLFFVERSQWMAEQVLSSPHLLDEMLDDRPLRELPDKKSKVELLNEQLRLVADDDLEQAMNVCRRFKASQQFSIAAADVAGYLPVMRVSDHLSELAEVILQATLDWVAAELQLKTGRPRLQRGDEVCDAQMLVVGYGKLGGLELGYGSDLDLVLLHDGDGKALGTDGEKSLENAVYFQRLGQRFVNFLSANTSSGRLYEIDTRLRPSGNSGLLVTSLQAYEKYQQESAWTWEHQALVRARAVAGPARLAAQFDQLRLRLLASEREVAKLKSDVTEMREKMRTHLDDTRDDYVNLKHAPGGLVDIEFICQYLVLRYAAACEGLFAVTDNVRQLAALAKTGALTSSQADQLTEAYIAVRGATHHQRLGCDVGIGAQELSLRRQQVVAIWQELLE